jgi:hypothetical protein
MPASPRPSTCTATSIPGDMDRYADRLDSAAHEAGKAKIRPDGTGWRSEDEMSGL